MIRSTIIGLALVVAAASAQAAPLNGHSWRNAKGNGGCGSYSYRGAGGNCVYYGAEQPDGYYGYSYYQPYRPYKYSQP